MSKQDRATLNASVKALESSIDATRDEYHTISDDYGSAVGRLMVRFALALWNGVQAKRSLGLDHKAIATWRDRMGAGFGSRKDDGTYGALTPPSLYRYLNAGRVASVLGDSVGEAAYTSLVPLYRILADADGKDEKAQTAATALVVKTWKDLSKGSKGSPTTESVLQAAESIAPPSRGKTGKTAAQRKASTKAKNARAKNTPTATGENDGKGNSVVVTIDPAAVEAAGKIVASTVTSFVRKTGTQDAVVRSIMLATIRLVREHGADTIAAAMAGKTAK